ncbi:MAG: hypothetical protein KKC26_06205 [Nanoarchaeota archaeon]|nr:hypothetical protein [Nanoarchaeota archaeon]
MAAKELPEEMKMITNTLINDKKYHRFGNVIYVDKPTNAHLYDIFKHAKYDDYILPSITGSMYISSNFTDGMNSISSAVDNILTLRNTKGISKTLDLLVINTNLIGLSRSDALSMYANDYGSKHNVDFYTVGLGHPSLSCGVMYGNYLDCMLPSDNPSIVRSFLHHNIPKLIGW